MTSCCLDNEGSRERKVASETAPSSFILLHFASSSYAQTSNAWPDCTRRRASAAGIRSMSAIQAPPEHRIRPSVPEVVTSGNASMGGHGLAGARRTLGGWGAMSGPPITLIANLSVRAGLDEPAVRYAGRTTGVVAIERDQGVATLRDVHLGAVGVVQVLGDGHPVDLGRPVVGCEVLPRIEHSVEDSVGV